MIVDANILLYAVDADSPQHARASGWLTAALNGPQRVGLPWESLAAFLRISTHPGLGRTPIGPEVAFAEVQRWLAAPAAWVPTPTDRHTEILGRLVTEHDARGNLIPDTHLAALALSHGVGVCSSDTDFARFTELRWVNPLA